MEIIYIIWNFLCNLLFFGWTDGNIYIALDPITVILVAVALAETGDKFVDEKKKAKLERQIGKLSSDEKQLLLDKVQREQNFKAKTQIINNAVKESQDIDNKKQKVGIIIGISGILISIFLMFKITKE
jgi:hypothetical protein